MRTRFSSLGPRSGPNEGRIELRRLTAPVYRQPENTAGDGAMFAFASGTNPEILLSLRTTETAGATRWTYTVGALSADALTLVLDGQEVWSEGRFRGPATRKQYTNGRFPEAS